MTNPLDYQGPCKGPGKFEGEVRATEYYYEVMLSGSGECVGEGLTLFEADAVEAEAFANDLEIDVGDLVVLYESDQGFIHCLTFGSRASARMYFNSIGITFED